MDEIYTYAPQLAHIITDKISKSSIKSKEVFERNCNIIFPEKRKFMSYRQLDQYMTLFLESWNIKTDKVFNFSVFTQNVRENTNIRVIH